MRVVCDNCSASYNIPDHKLSKAVNKATCRKCGHRMLIPRPGPGAGPVPSVDEKTQITDIPAQHGGELALSAADEELHEERPTVAVDLAPPPAPVRARQSAPAMPSPAAPAPASAAPAPVGGHDPGGDLGVVLGGSLIAAVGAMTLAVNIGGDATLRVVGLLLALAGALSGLFVLVTGDRGRRPASVGASVGLAVVFAALGAGGVHAVASSLSAPEPITVAASPPPPPAPKPTPAPAAASTLAAEEPEPAPAPVEAPAPAVAAAPRPAPVEAVPVRGSGRDVAATPAPAPRAEPAPRPEPAPAPAPASAPARSGPPVDPTVMHTIISNNSKVKRCYMDQKQRTGELPRVVRMNLSVQPSGAVSKARVVTAEFKGTEFDVCLSAAVRSLNFPPFEGSSAYTTDYQLTL
ncbi:MAG: zinc-ribbon domain-containing protein [Deltaproteobacteria bacterium]|nr:zinc-ribbon domain-containing protein [Deltaproteobacteria bacterium]